MIPPLPPPPRALLWLRRDLRLQDHPALTAALDWLSAQPNAERAELLCVWSWGEAEEARSGARKAWRWRESALSLQRDLRALGGELWRLEGSAVTALPLLARALRVERVFAHHLTAHDEVEEERRVSLALRGVGAHLELRWGHTLCEPRALPFSLDALPDVFTAFRKLVERELERRGDPPAPLRAPTRLPPPPPLSPPLAPASPLPLAPLSPLPPPPSDPRAVLPFTAGEAGGLERLRGYLWGSANIERYYDTRNGLIGEAYSTKLSPWLATGALSARQVWAEVRRYERERVANQSTYWVLFELLWREYFQWVALRWGPHLFQPAGLRGAQRGARPRRTSPSLTRAERERFLSWCEGRTGQPFVDANMRELAATGWMSNRGRQNVASYLVHDLGVEWRAGAEHFERSLIDDDPASNWGNWAYVAGVGNDPMPQRRFHVRGQAERYDPDGRYQALWGAP